VGFACGCGAEKSAVTIQVAPEIRLLTTTAPRPRHLKLVVTGGNQTALRLHPKTGFAEYDQ
jgi:hypothetical protein